MSPQTIVPSLGVFATMLSTSTVSTGGSRLGMVSFGVPLCRSIAPGPRLIRLLTRALSLPARQVSPIRSRSTQSYITILIITVLLFIAELGNSSATDVKSLTAKPEHSKPLPFSFLAAYDRQYSRHYLSDSALYDILLQLVSVKSRAVCAQT